MAVLDNPKWFGRRPGANRLRRQDKLQELLDAGDELARATNPEWDCWCDKCKAARDWIELRKRHGRVIDQLTTGG